MVKSKQKPTRFEASHNLIKLRDEITKLCMNNFSFSVDRARERREKYKEQHINLPNIDDIMRRYNKKMDYFEVIYLEDEIKYVLRVMRDIQREFTLGNSIYPSDNISGVVEFIERRKHMSKSIGLLYDLKHELHYIFRTLPVDMNKYKHLAELIDKQIGLIKGVRQSDNRFLKTIKIKKYTFKDLLVHLFGDVILE